MRAAVSDRYGPPEVVEVREVPAPTPGDGEVLVRVHVATVNRTDCGFRAAHPWIVRPFSGIFRPKRPILGTEFAGVVEGLGPGVDTFSVGDRVFGFTGDDRFGAHAELVTVPADGALATIPDGLTFEQVAGTTEGSHYALSGIDAVGIRAGQRVLVHGATGAIGSAAVQLLKGIGAAVTATCETEHVDLVRSLGADRVVDWTAEDFTKDTERYDLVLDAVGKSSFGRCKGLLTPRGVYLSSELGPLSMNPFLALVTKLSRGKRVRFPVPPKHSRAEVERIRAMLSSGAFRSVVDRTYPLDRIAEAYRYVETGRKIGNVLIQVTQGA